MINSQRTLNTQESTVLPFFNYKQESKRTVRGLGHTFRIKRMEK